MKIKLRKLLSVMLVTTLAIAPAISDACSSLVLRSPDGSYVYGRTIEFGIPLPAKLALYPRNYQYQGTGPDGVAGSGLIGLVKMQLSELMQWIWNSLLTA